ncbi:uncharacterized protein B0I36DRAFT_99730 [Microdochium trichocladiopsis]|uniref:Uncharacterized protein n=1 Tax=Microdochium trichocladiopsis TaxID=1682393 RepID=A0A9P9BRA6_9PEZI|nr:uncharacterized protein B0I36DRAFT_99730 [Microdochium trichocladiopsis]KAH7032696.1 hypothetical protein B0I36DRAFT_99730 [Microdochium trichocladiopsis]
MRWYTTNLRRWIIQGVQSYRWRADCFGTPVPRVQWSRSIRALCFVSTGGCSLPHLYISNTCIGVKQWRSLCYADSGDITQQGTDNQPPTRPCRPEPCPRGRARVRDTPCPQRRILRILPLWVWGTPDAKMFGSRQGATTRHYTLLHSKLQPYEAGQIAVKVPTPPLCDPAVVACGGSPMPATPSRELPQMALPVGCRGTCCRLRHPVASSAQVLSLCAASDLLENRAKTELNKCAFSPCMHA